MSRKPRVTILMPVFNGEKYLREAIESILSQSFTDYEFLIINDGSTDNSETIINSYQDQRIRLINNQQNLKLIATLNKGITLAMGEYIARMDCDDISLPDRLLKQVRFMDSHPRIGVSGTWVETCGDINGLKWEYPTDPDEIKAKLIFESVLAHPAVIIRKDYLLNHNLSYSENYLHAEDWKLWQDCAGYFQIANIPEFLLKYRLSKQSITYVCREQQLQTIRKIDSENIKKLKIEATPEEMQIHRGLAFLRFSADENFFDKADLWLRKLYQANCLIKIYPEPAFTEILGERWFLVCSQLTDLGWVAYRNYWKSPLSRLKHYSFSKQIKLLIKCGMRYKNERI